MALRANYSVATGSNVDISARVRAYQMSVMANAEQGSVAMPVLNVDDPEGGINIIGLRNITLSETAESSNQQVIFTGFTAARDITRGQDSFRTRASRLWAVSLVDPNERIGRRIMRGSDANRPAETDVARVQWLLGTSEFGGICPTSRYVSTLYPVAMDAVDYRDQSNQQILDDCSQASGKNYFVFWDEPAGNYGLWYDFAGSSAYRSALRITNVLGYVDNDITFGASRDTQMTRDPARVFSGVLLPFVGGEVYVQNDTTANTFVRRDTTAPSVNVKTTAKATARANRYIADATTEADRIVTSIEVPLSRVNHIMHGMAVQVWLSHFPGYDTGWNWMRVLQRTVTATSEEFYTLELTMAAAVGGLLAGGGLTSDGATYPAPAIVAAAPLQSCVARDTLTYFYTSPGTRGGIGPSSGESYPGEGNFHFTSTDFICYWGAGGSASAYPLAGQDGNWGNGGVNNCVYTSGGADYGAGGVSNLITINVIGPGTLTVQTAAAVGLCQNNQNVVLTAVISGTATVVDTDTQMVGTLLSVTIPDDGECAHYVEVSSTGQFGFVSANWS